MNNILHYELPESAAHRFAARQVDQGFEFIALHPYQDVNGKPLYWRIRLKQLTTQEKWIRPMHRTKAGQYVLKEPHFPQGKPLYHLPDIIKHTHQTVWIVEGELCADRLAKLGLIATTSGGVESVATTDWSPLKNKNIVIWRDNDDAGLRYAQAVTQQLHALNCNIRWLDITQLLLPEKGDCIDWLMDHPDANKETIEALTTIEQLPKMVDQDSTENKSPQKKSGSTTGYFRLTEQAVYYDPPEGEPLPICSRLEIKALVRDSASENWGRLLVFRDADQQEHSWSMPMQMLKGSGEELRSELFRMGLDIAASKRARNLLIEYITSSKPELRARCVTRTGWYNQVFVFPNRTIGECSEVILYQSENPVRDYCQAGTLADWQQQVAHYCCGNSRLIFAVSTAFAALLLYPAGSESGGIHFVGESSTGKTTALRVAASVYGAPDYLNRWRATTNGLEALAALRSDTLLILDELAQVEPKEAGEIAYMLANGSGKTRAGKTGGTRPRYEWRLLFLSAGEIGLSQHMRQAGKQTRAGQAVRLVEVPADAGQGFGLFENLHEFTSPVTFSKTLNEASASYYGVAAQAFLEKITQPEIFATLNNSIREHYHSFIQDNLPAQASGQAARVCERFALIAAAGEMASAYGVTGWPPGIAKEAAKLCYQGWLQQRGGAGNQDRMALLQQVQAFFEAHGASRFENMDSANDYRIPNRVGFRRIKQIEQGNSEYEYFILPEMFRQEMCTGFDSRWAAKELIDAGMLQPTSTGKAQIPYRLPGAGVKKCYHFIRTEPLCKDQ